MIPKKLHYCWFGKGPIPQSQLDCIKTWSKVMPDYEIKRWDETNFDVNQFEFTRQAYEKKLYSFVTDIVRFYAIYTEGGIYLDTDIEMVKSFDPFLHHPWFSGIQVYYDDFIPLGLPLLGLDRLPVVRNKETEGVFTGSLGFNAAVIGSEVGNPFVKECMDWFTSRPFINQDGVLYNKVINPAIMPYIAEKLGFRYFNDYQVLSDGGVIYPANVFVCDEVDTCARTVAIHHSAQSWQPKTKEELKQLELDKKGLLKPYLFIKKWQKKFNHLIKRVIGRE